MTTGLKRVSIALLGASMMATAPADAAKINLIDTGGITGTPADRGLRAAAAFWESVITNDVEINFTAHFSRSGFSVATGAPAYTSMSVASYYESLRSGGTSALDAIAVSHLSPLSPGGAVKAIIPDYLDPTTKSGIALSGTRLTPDGAMLGTTISIATATQKALVNNSAVYKATYGTVIDGDLDINALYPYNYKGLDDGSIDFVGVAIHEMGHALGFVSGVETFDYYGGQSIPDIDNNAIGTAFDIFRYSGEGKLDWTPKTHSYFSIDGGATPFMDGYLATGSTQGDGNYSGHWQACFMCSRQLGIMNPYVGKSVVTALDLAAFDAMGWNINVDVLKRPGYRFTSAQAIAMVPEPATWAMMILGFGAVGGALRRRRAVLAIA